MSKLSHFLTGIVAFGLGINTANFINNSNREQRSSPTTIAQTLPSTLEGCVLKGVITDSNIPTLDRERIRMRASGLYPIKVGISVNDGPNEGHYEFIVEGFTNPKNGSPKNEGWKEGYQDLFDTFSSGLSNGDTIPFSCGYFDSLRSNQYPLPRIVKVQ